MVREFYVQYILMWRVRFIIKVYNRDAIEFTYVARYFWVLCTLVATLW